MGNRDPIYLDLYFEEARELFRGLRVLLDEFRREPGDAETQETLRRIAHTAKTSAGLMGFAAVSAYARALEAVMNRVKTAPAAPDKTAVRAIGDGFECLRDAVAELEATGAENRQGLESRTRRLETLPHGRPS